MFVDPILEGIGHGDEPGAGVGREGLLGRAAASPAAADQANLDRAAAGGMHEWDCQAGDHRRGGSYPCERGGRALQEIAPAGWLRGAGGGSENRRLRGLRSVSHGGAPVEGWRIRVGRDPLGPFGLQSW